MPVQYDQVRALTVKDVMELFHVPHIRRVKEKVRWSQMMFGNRFMILQMTGENTAALT